MRVKIDNFLSSEECEKFTSLAETSGMKKAWIITPEGPVVQENYRNNDRYIFDDHDLAKSLFERLKSNIDDSDKDWQLTGLNERFKIYRYDPGQNFAMHTDTQFSRSEDEKSFKTILIYLNDDYKGGETEFFGMDMIEPQKGRAIVFMHHLLHEGMPVKSGCKYALRTDVMYRKRSLIK